MPILSPSAALDYIERLDGAAQKEAAEVLALLERGGACIGDNFLLIDRKSLVNIVTCAFVRGAGEGME